MTRSVTDRQVYVRMNKTESDEMEGFSEALDKIEEYIERLLKYKEILLIAIDGKSGSGKSTLAGRLADRYDANLYHMDDFFLQPFQRTPERLAEIGGNVDYERFKQQVLEQLLENRNFSYGIFNCRRQEIVEYRQVKQKRMHIIEGSYSEHPYFGSPYDLTVCLDIGEDVQKERIRMRNGEEMLKRFVEEWIPKENAYLEKFRIREQSNLYIRV